MLYNLKKIQAIFAFVCVLISGLTVEIPFKKFSINFALKEIITMLLTLITISSGAGLTGDCCPCINSNANLLA